MKPQASPGRAAFIGTGALMLAWYLTPGPGSYWQQWVLVAILVLGGVQALILAIQNSEGRPWPRLVPGTGIANVGRVIWFLRPPLWILAWALIFTAVYIYGTPHLKWNYSYRPGNNICDYVGFNGIERVQAGWSVCPTIMWLPINW